VIEPAAQPAVGGGLRLAIRLIQIDLIANAVPAAVVLLSLPGRTADLFVWTVVPSANARVLGVMYLSAALLVAASWRFTRWSDVRVTFVVIAPFAVLATAVTFLTLDPFLDHPAGVFGYWLVEYLVLVAAAPAVAVVAERRFAAGPVQAPVSPAVVAVWAACAAALLTMGALLLLRSRLAEDAFWPFALAPLSARIIGVWLLSLGLAWAVAALQRDAVAARPLAVACIPSGLLLALVPGLHTADAHDRHLALYLPACALLVAAGVSAWRAARVERRAMSLAAPTGLS
jgi:hypothetical protein